MITYIKCTMTVLTLELITRFTKYVDSHVVCYLIKYIVIIMNKYIIMYFLFFFCFFLTTY